jgi:2-haloalkanoic acid dehalogenase type II
LLRPVGDPTMNADHTDAGRLVPNVKEIRTITVDLDDTLWEIYPVIRRAEQRLRDWLEQHYPRITEMFALEDIAEVRARVLEMHADMAYDLTFVRRTLLTEMATAAGYNKFLVDDAFAVFEEARNDVEVFPEVRPALRALRERYTLIAVTNGNADLDRIGISDLFDDHVNAAMAGAAKPERPIFDVAVKAGGASAAETLHVGDHPLYDVHGAKQAGLRTAWVNRNGSDWPIEYELPDAEVAHVGELLTLIGVDDE